MENHAVSVQNAGAIQTHRPALEALKEFARRAGISQPTVWRWRRAGWLKTINISGRPYVRAEDAQEFILRAQSGEFAKPPAGAARKRTAPKGGSL